MGTCEIAKCESMGVLDRLFGTVKVLLRGDWSKNFKNKCFRGKYDIAS